MKTLLIALSLVLSLTACQSLIQDVDPGRLPKTDPQLVVHCYVSPQDTVLVAAISLSRTSVGVQTTTNQFNALPNAVVTLSDETHSVVLGYNSLQGLYQTKPERIPIQAGRTYTLKVTTPDGLSATANATVPAAVPIADYQLDSSAARFESGITDYFIHLRWRDPVNTFDFYHVAGDNEYGSVGRVYQGNGSFTEVPYRAVNSVFFRYDNQSPYLTDEKRDGQLITSPRGRLSFTYINGKRTATPPILVNVYLLHVNESYYRYHEIVQQQNQTNDNPFAEPVLVTSNVQGGFGCFGAYNRSSLTLTLK